MFALALLEIIIFIDGLLMWRGEKFKVCTGNIFRLSVNKVEILMFHI